MPKRIQAISAVLAAITVFLCGCGDNTPHTTDAQSTAGETTDVISVDISQIVTDDGTEPATDAPEEEPLYWEGPHVKSLKIGGVDVSEFTVVCQSSAKTPKKARDELIKYVEAATGVTLKISDGESAHEICIGETDRDTDRVRAARDTLVNNGCAVICDGGRLYLTGADQTGTLYAVYTFLEEQLGCRFYTSKVEEIKFSRGVEVPDGFEYVHSPKLFNRDTFWYDTFEPAFAAKMKINGYVNRNMDAGYGSTIKYAGQFVHSLPYLAGTSKTPNDQPCLTDPAVYEKVLAQVRRLLRGYNDSKIVSVSQNDSFPGALGCQCENCKKLDDEQGTPMGSLLTFVNRIANDIKDEFPDVYVDTLAYRYTRKPPKTLKPADNVIIRLCSIECCFSHPLDDPDCPANKEFCEDIEAWSKICKNLFIWDYTTNFMYYVNPFPNLGVLYDNVRFFIDHNVIGLYEQGNGQSYSGEFGELRAYLIAKLMWDPDMTRERYYEYMDEFLKGYYGDGWRYIREYIDKTTAKAAEGHMGIYDSIDKVMPFTGAQIKRTAARVEFTKELQALWDKAYEEADDEHKPNVEKSSMQIISASLYTRWYKASSPEKLQHLHELMKKYNITFHRENVRVPDTVDYTKNINQW